MVHPHIQLADQHTHGVINILADNLLDAQHPDFGWSENAKLTFNEW